MTSVAEVQLWGSRIGAVSLDDAQRFARFQYDPDFARSGIELSPLAMPLSSRVYTFPALPFETFHGLPGLLADSLPDRFGNRLIDAWLAAQGRPPGSFDAIERLSYTGARGMGALEFVPATGPDPSRADEIHVDRLVALATAVLSSRSELSASLDGDPEAALTEILRVGTSAGGARAKAIVAWNEATGEVRSGQLEADSGFEHWLLKFDGVGGNRDKELEDPEGYTVIEYAYSRMAAAAGIEMEACRLLEENGRRHFMTRRFDRTASGDKLHMQSLGALAHLDYNAPGENAYEDAFHAIRQLDLGAAAAEQQFRRMCFNVAARNQDDHVKNIAFLMNRSGDWSLSPAFDVTYSYNPQGRWTGRHQMSIHGKRDAFTRDDFRECARTALLKRGRADTILDDVIATVARWEDFAADAGLAPDTTTRIAAAHRLGIA